jgi:hypothetical protein
MDIEQMRAEIIKYMEPIISTGFQGLKTAPGVTHVIELVDQKPFREKYRAVPHSKRADFNKLLNELIHHKIIVESKSPYSSPPHVLLKPDGSIRFTIDYKRLNSLTIKDNYPLPVIDDLFKDMIGCTFYSKTDLESGYYQVELDEQSRKYTAFSCELGLFEWTKMPMGLKNSGASFQRCMNKILAPAIGKYAHVYQDDIIIFSKTAQEHKQHVQSIVDLLKEAQLKVKLKKCSFFQREIEFLGHQISKNGITPTKSKIEALFRYKQPTTLKQLLSFLGLASYYRKFIDHFTMIAHALYECCIENKLNKYKLKKWTEECQASFDALRTYLTESDKVLMLPDLNKAFKLFCDACDYGVGAVLTQQDEQKNWRPISYFSKHLSKTERRYSVSERELLSIIRAVEFHKQFLLCNPNECTIVTDHQPLTWLMTHKNPSARLLRWITRLEQYTLRFEYRKGSQHQNADSMSRWPLPDDDEDGTDDFNDIIINTIILETETSLMKVEHKLVTNGNCDQFVEFKVMFIGFRRVNGAHQQACDENIQMIINSLKNSQVPPDQRHIKNAEQRIYVKEWNNLVMDNNTLWRRAKDQIGNEFTQLVLPQAQRVPMMERLHARPLSGHLMMDKTFARMTARFFWPFMKRDVQSFIDQCQECQLANHPHKTPRALLKPIQADRILELVTSDYMGPLKQSRKGNINILVISDHKSKFAWFRPTRLQTAKVTAQHLAKIQLEFGLFEKLLTDQGPNYESDLIAELCHLLDTDKLRTTPYHPICDGLSEKLNQSLIKMIKTLINENHNNWDELLPALEFAYNTSVHATTKMTPYFMMFGRHPKVPEDLIFDKPDIDFPVSDQEFVQQTKENLQQAFKFIKFNSDSKIDLAKIQYNRNHISCKFEIGDTDLGPRFQAS